MWSRLMRAIKGGGAPVGAYATFEEGTEGSISLESWRTSLFWRQIRTRSILYQSRTFASRRHTLAVRSQHTIAMLPQSPINYGDGNYGDGDEEENQTASPQ